MWPLSYSSTQNFYLPYIRMSLFSTASDECSQRYHPHDPLFFGFQFSNNLRSAIGSWNMGTNIWLRFLVYERLEKYESIKTICTFLLSAVWHGVYPGYYLTFLTAAVLVSSARTVSALFGVRTIGEIRIHQFSCHRVTVEFLLFFFAGS